MTTDYRGARDEIFAAVRAAWNTVTASVVGSQQKLFYQGVVKDGAIEIGKPTEYWARVSLRTVTQGSIGPGARRHNAAGLVFVQCFFPLTERDSWTKGIQIATAVKNAFAHQSSSGTVWFRNPRIDDGLSPENGSHRLNVVAEFEYDESVA